MFDEVTGSHQTNINPTEIASTADLRSALGVGVAGEAAARAVIGRMIKKTTQATRRVERLATDCGKGRGPPGGGELSGDRGNGSHFPVRSGGGGRGKVAPEAEGRSSREKQADTRRMGGNIEPRGRRGKGRGGGSRGNTTAAVKGPRATKAVKGIAGSGTGAGFLEEGIFKTALSSLAKKRLRAGLLEIKTNPIDVLRRGFVEIEPARHGSTALGCHLIKGWVAQKAGNKRRVSSKLSEIPEIGAKVINTMIWVMEEEMGTFPATAARGGGMETRNTPMQSRDRGNRNGVEQPRRFRSCRGTPRHKKRS